MDLFLDCHADFRMISQIAIKGRSTTFLSTTDQEIDQPVIAVTTYMVCFSEDSLHHAVQYK